MYNIIQNNIPGKSSCIAFMKKLIKITAFSLGCCKKYQNNEMHCHCVFRVVKKLDKDLRTNKLQSIRLMIYIK